ncbi:transmembrane protein 276 isoform X2 [Apteryx mantelli]|uniref:Transmembrane protein 276 isoform X2 n=1 Tax=Apteryx mantelli TaxID=2696672 RepID=A0ABM4E0E8_9AVES
MADEWGAALGHAVLCAVCLRSALRTCQLNRGTAAGFLLQALAAAAEALGAPASPTTATVPAAWVCAVLAPPLLAFGFHWLSGDRATANLLLGAGVAAVVAVAAGGGGLPAEEEEGRAVAAGAVAALCAAAPLTLAALTGSAGGALGGLLLGASGLLWRLPPRCARPWLLAAANWALQRLLTAQPFGPD